MKLTAMAAPATSSITHIANTAEANGLLATKCHILVVCDLKSPGSSTQHKEQSQSSLPTLPCIAAVTNVAKCWQLLLIVLYPKCTADNTAASNVPAVVMSCLHWAYADSQGCLSTRNKQSRQLEVHGRTGTEDDVAQLH